MKLQQLKYIVCVAQCGSILEASKQLFVSQPSLTNSIKELEQEMNVTIFQRHNKGVILTSEGETFLAYARQVLEQASLLEDRFIHKKSHRSKFSLSCQHYVFAVSAFMDVIKQYGNDQYDFTLRETKTHEIIEDVSNLKSEIGVLYTSSKNEEVIMKLIKQHDLVFTPLFKAKPHVFLAYHHPLADKEIITIDDLQPYPYLSFEQGEYNSFYYSEEILSSLDRNKNIKVRDRATMLNMIVGLNGYTICSGIISEQLNGERIIAKALNVDEYMNIGIITKKNVPLSIYAQAYIDSLKNYIPK